MIDIHNLSFYEELFVLFCIFVVFILGLSLAVENRELRQAAKKDAKLRDKQRGIIGFYRTYLLTRHGRVFDEDEELVKYYNDIETDRIFKEILKEE